MGQTGNVAGDEGGGYQASAICVIGKLRQGKEGCLEWVAQLMKVFLWLLKQFFEAQNGTYQAKDHTKSDELPIHDKIPTKFMHKF